LVYFNPCSVLLIKILVAPCSTLLLLLFNVATTPLALHCYSFCSTFLLLVQHRCYSLFDVTIALCSTLLHCYCLFNIAIFPSWHYYCSLFNVAVVPCSTLLLFLLDVTLLAWRYYSSYSTLLMFFIWRYCCSCSILLSLLNTTTPLAQHCYSFARSSSCGLSKYLFVMHVMSLFLAPCPMMLLLFLLFHIGTSPLCFLQVWEELSKFKFFWLDF
jgi:hypothetical protein